MKIPVIDIYNCNGCEGCISLCPTVFRWNAAAGYIEVIEMEIYPEAEVQEAIKLCPAKVISWEDS